MSDSQSSQSSGSRLSSQKRKKYSWVVIAAILVGTVVGSGIVKDSVKWADAGGFYAIIGIAIVWIIFMIIGIAMADNASMMPEKGGVYAWARITLGRFWGCQVGWIYLIGYTCLSVVLSWLACLNTISAITYFFPGPGAFLSAQIFSFILPLLYITVFTLIFLSGVKRTTQIIIAFFVIKTTMWLTIIGIGILHYDPSVAINTADMPPFIAVLAVVSLSVFAMLGLDSASVFIDDVHKPGRNFLKGTIIGMLIVLALYIGTIIAVMGLVGQAGAYAYISSGITQIFLDLLSVPSPVLLIFIVISITGTLFVTMYLVVRLSGAMAEHRDFFFQKNVRKRIEKKGKGTNIQKIEMPRRAILFQPIVYAIFFVLIYIENNFGTYFVLYNIYYMGVLGILVILFMIALTNLKAHVMGLAKKRRKEKKEFRWLRGILLPIIGMLAMAFVISLSVFYMWTTPEFPLPGPSDSEAWVIWQSLGKIFPFFIVVPGLIFWFVVLRPKLKAEEVAVEKLDIPVAD